MMRTTNIAHTFNNDLVNHDRLMDVIAGRRDGPGCGKTFAWTMLMLGEAWFGDPGNTYLYIGETVSHVHNVMHYFEEILTKEGFNVASNERRSHDRLFVGDENHLTKLFLFWSADGWLYSKARGWNFTQAFPDVSDELYYKWVSGTSVGQWTNKLQSS